MTFHINYRMNEAGRVRFIDVPAKSKKDAYDRAKNELIPAAENGANAFSVWVVSCTYSNGNYRRFDTTERKPF